MKKLLLLISCLCHVSYVFAVDRVTLKLGSITGTGWQADRVVAQLHWLSNKRIALRLNIATLMLPELKKPLKNLKLTCQRTEYSATKIACPSADLHIDGNLLDQSIVNLSFTYHLDSQEIYFRLGKVALAGGSVLLIVKSAPTGWHAQFHVKKVDLKKLVARLETLIDLPSKLAFGGHTNLKIILSGDSGVRSAIIKGHATGLSFSNAVGTQAGENMDVKIAFNAKRNSSAFEKVGQSSSVKKVGTQNALKKESNKQFHMEGTLTVNQGELLIDSFYLKIIKDKPVIMAVDLTWQPQILNVDQLTYTHTDVMTLLGNGELALGEKWAINKLTLRSRNTLLKQFYTHYLKGFLAEDSQLSDLEVSGIIKAALSWDKDQRSGIVQLYDVNMEDQQKRFGLKGFHGKIQWHSHAQDLPSHLRWSSAYFASSIQLGTSQLRASLSGNQIKLLAPWYQPIVDGALRIEQFRLENLGEADMSWQLQGRLEPISLPVLSAALDWPPLKGKLAGEFPSVNYRDKHLDIEGKLHTRIFDGEIVAQRLSLDNPFGRTPALKADIDITRLNLKTLTGIAEFGEIQGQLSGYVHDLHLVNWQPKSFDAYLGTPKDDTTRHIISHKALKNLSSLEGGAVMAALSRGVLSIFDNFYYQRLGWGCQLKNGSCQVRGVLPAENGYYIVKGSGLPRIDVVGYNKLIDWNELLNRLKRITEASETDAPVLQ